MPWGVVAERSGWLAMKRFRFVHAADLHLDTPFSGIGRAAPAVSQALRDASLDCFDALIDLTIARQAEFLLLAGDIYDGPERGIRAQIRFRRGLERLVAAGGRAILVHGNHDPLDGWSAMRQHWPPGVTLLGAEDVQTVAIEQGAHRLATIHGMSYPRRDVTENLARRFRRGSEPGLHIGLLHCNVGSNPDHAPYSPCTVDDLRATGMDYWALGHIHRHQVIQRSAPWIVYPGNTQGRSPRASELGAKGAVVVEVEEGRVRDVEFAAIDRARFVQWEVDVSSCSDAAAVVRAISMAGAAQQSRHAGRGLIVTAVLTGDPDGDRFRGRNGADTGEGEPLGGQLNRFEVREAMLHELRHEWEGNAPFVWWRAIENRTRARIDTEAIRGRGDFSAELLGLSERLAVTPEAVLDLLEADAEPLRRVLAAPALRDVDLSVDGPGLLAEARMLALGVLEADDAT